MSTKELTYGNPFKLIIAFMIPVFLGNLFQQLYHFVDALIVGRVLGIDTLAAVGATGPFIFLIISFIFASTQGFSVVTAQRFGAQDYHMVKKSLTASLILSGALTLVLTAICLPLTESMLVWLKTPANILQPATDYLFIMFAGIFATVFYNVSSNIIRALGDSKTPLYFLIFSAIINIFMDLLLIIKFNMGVEGAAYATVISQGISTVLCMSYMFWKFPILRVKKEDWFVSKDFLLEHLKIGIPMGFQMSVLTLGILAFQFVLNSFGSVAIAALTTALRIDQMFTQSFLALGATMAVYTAQNFGANKMSRIRAGVKTSILLAVIISIFSIAMISLFSKEMIMIFMSDINYEVIRLAQLYLYIIMVFFIFFGTLIIFRNILQGMGQVWAPLASGVAELIARTICAFVLGHYFGYIGLCTATPAAWVAASIVLFVGYRISLSRHLKQIKNKDTEIEPAG